MPNGALSDGLILAALERAERHRHRGGSRSLYPSVAERHSLGDAPGVVYSALVAHLGLRMGSGAGRRVRPRIRELEAAGLVRASKRRGAVVYTLSPLGWKRLVAARRAGEVGALPESPQHRAWREARRESEERIEEFRDAVWVSLDETAGLLAHQDPPSEAWFVLGEHLQRACGQLGSATHCLREWNEPDDSSTDVDDGPRRGRRNHRLWSASD